jgi:hypothetical protein
MLADRELLQPYRKKYAGQNQASLGYVLEHSYPGKVVTLPCSVWNCEDSTWPEFRPERTRIVHVKGQLRLAALGLGSETSRVRHLASFWRATERRIAGHSRALGV